MKFILLINNVMGGRQKQRTAVVVGRSFQQLVSAHPPSLSSDRAITGAGAGGIAAAARLAKAGFQVTVVEKNDFTGGRCSLIRHGEYVLYPRNDEASNQEPDIPMSASIKVLRSSSSPTSFARPFTISTPVLKPRASNC